MTAPNTSLFDSDQAWLTTPQEAFVAWLMAPDFVVTKSGAEQPLRTSSVVVYRAMGNKFVREVLLGEDGGLRKTWRDIDAEDIHAFLAKNELKRGIRNRYVRLLERLFDHLMAKGIVSANPARGLAIKEPSKSNQYHDKTQWLTEAQQEALVAALPQAEGWKDARNRALIATVLGGGLKVSEVIKLTNGCVGPRQEDGSLYIDVYPAGAGRRHRTRVAVFAAAILLEWMTTRKQLTIPSELLFPAKLAGGVLHPATVYRQVAAVLAEARIDPTLIKRRGARTLRNTFAINELEEGKPPELVGEYLGHRAARSTRYYTALVRKPSPLRGK
ncbi:tyrosine-type recombinase/integrase [Aromatoleum buckelii]|uniref:Tyrosine-type recombinase/integrase n=1 Tax=Aromatoleum buckelii TaxID=200254 RepID=A0ABX1MZ64_9RHOO|nr:tyrosine-type recombinase/integrase [Aromatoleum buckelii]MCK0512991.1 site-specific integrase [Aromatoleum buckelii]